MVNKLPMHSSERISLLLSVQLQIHHGYTTSRPEFSYFCLITQIWVGHLNFQIYNKYKNTNNVTIEIAGDTSLKDYRIT